VEVIDEVNSVGSIKLLTYSWSPWVVDTRDKVETYPDDPRPATVDANLPPKPNPNTVEVMEEVNSVGSIKLLIYSWSPWVVDTRDKLETYPEDPRPATVEVNLSPRPNPNTVEVIDEVNSVGSIKVLIYSWRP